MCLTHICELHFASLHSFTCLLFDIYLSRHQLITCVLLCSSKNYYVCKTFRPYSAIIIQQLLIPIKLTMITLSIDASVLIALTKAMPKTNKAELALEKYKEVLKQLIEHSLMNMDDNLFRFFGQFLVSTHQLELETGQFVIDGKKQYLHKWLKLNGLSLIKVVKVGLKGSDVSSVKLTHLVKMTDAMDLKVLKQKKIHELDALLNDKLLDDIDF